MKKNIITLIAAGLLSSSLILASSSVTVYSSATSPSTSASQGEEPVEQGMPETDFKPMYEGQTRIKGIKTEKEVVSEVIAEGLDSPWAVEELPDGRLVITERTGSLRITDKDGKVGEAIGGFPETDSSGQGGILDVLPAEDFKDSRILFFTISEKTEEGSVTAVGKGRLSGDETKIEDFEIIFRALPYFKGSNHYGSRLAFDEKGNLLVSTGERQTDETRDKAQELDNGYGKILRITTDGKPAEGNPFIGKEGIMPEIYSYGHRNVQGLAVDPRTNEIWAAEMGPQGGDELNLIKPGLNYGWPVISYGEEYTGLPVKEGISHKEGMEQPVYYWDPVIAPSGMSFYNSDSIPEWKDNLFIACLRGEHIARIEITDNKITGEERLLEGEGERFRDVTIGSDGALYAVTDSGKLYKIRTAQE